MKQIFKPSSFASVYALLACLYVVLLVSITLSFELALLPELKHQRASSIAHLVQSHGFDIEVMRTKALRDTLADKGVIADDRSFKQLIVSENLEDIRLFLSSCKNLTATVCHKGGYIGVVSGANLENYERAHSLIVLKSSHIDSLSHYRVWALAALLLLSAIFSLAFFLIRKKHFYFSVRDQKMLSAIRAISKEFKIPSNFEDKNEVDGVILDTVAQLQLFLRSLHLQIAQYQEWVSKKSKASHLGGNVAQVQHDLLGPLREISESLKHLSAIKSKLSDEDFEEHVSSIRASAQALSKRISSSLKLSDHEATRAGDEISRLCLKFLASHSLPKSFVDLHWAPEVDTLIWKWGNFESVFFNMMQNSKQAGATHVRVDALIEKDKFRIEVLDNGSGVSEFVGDQIFSDFVSTKEEGHGFGMASVKSTIESAGGNIELVASQSGARFVIRLPIQSSSSFHSKETQHENV